MIIVADNEKNIFFTDKFFDIYINVSTKKDNGIIYRYWKKTSYTWRI